MNERQHEILRILDAHGSVSAAELSDRFHCSKVTIRNDIRMMAAEDLLERTHGGALKKQKDSPDQNNGQPSVPEVRFSMGNITRKAQEKKQIAAAAYSYIRENDTIILDDSSACYYLAEHISRHPEKRIAVLTNSLPSAVVLSERPHVELYMVGGHVGGTLAATMGDQAAESFRTVCVDKAFIGVHSINFRVGLTSIGTLQMQIKKAILQTTDKVFVLADSTKFGIGYLEVICPLKDVYRIITDDGLEKAEREEAEKEGVKLEICPLNGD